MCTRKGFARNSMYSAAFLRVRLGVRAPQTPKPQTSTLNHKTVKIVESGS